ncbi:MAG TPA: DUF2231 domain-containing protein [Candidatus Eisenbacteria bacterium]
MLFYGLEIHTAIVHFPIALGIVGAVALLAYAIFRWGWLRWFAPVLLTLALLGAGGAYFSGKSAEDRAEHAGVPDRAIDEHQDAALWGIGVLALATLLTWATVPRGRGIWIAVILALMAGAALARAGHLGGKLVFEYGAGRVPGSPAAGVKAGAAAAPAAGGEAEEHDGRSEGHEH